MILTELVQTMAKSIVDNARDTEERDVEEP